MRNNWKFYILLILFSQPILAEYRTKIAVIDSGIYKSMQYKKFMCKEKPKSFIDNNPYDVDSHGSNIVGIIGEALNPKTHCIVSYKFYSSIKTPVQNTEALIAAMKAVLKDHRVKYLNLSLGGYGSDDDERNTLIKLLKRGVVVITAAGNNGENLNLNKNKYYPASYRDNYKHKNFYVVGTRSSWSNYGKVVTDIYNGKNVGPKTMPYIPKKTGTSQAAAQKTADLVKKRGINILREVIIGQ